MTSVESAIAFVEAHNKSLSNVEWIGVYSALMEERTIYASQLDARDKEIEKRDKALNKINEIRNSIIGLQTINWSEHIYPLVAALNEAGIEGAGYPVNKQNFGTMLERTNAAEAQLHSLHSVAEKMAGMLNDKG